MKGKMLLIPLVLLLIASLVAVGCAAPAPAPAPGPVPAAGPEKITWMYGYYGPSTHPQVVPPGEEWAANVAARVWPEYDFELKWAFGGVIAQASEIIDATGAGMQDCGRWMPSKGPGKTDLSDLASFPVLPVDYEAASNAQMEFYRTPLIVEEYAKWNCKVLAPSVFSPQNLILTFPAESLADLDGKKIRIWGPYCKMYEKVGVVPILFSISEVYEALSRGIVEGAMTGYPENFVTYHFHDIAKHIILVGTGPTGSPIIVNSDSWNALPAKVQEAMNAETNLMGKYSKKHVTAAEAPAFEALAEAGVVIREVPAADKVKFMALVYEVVDEVVAELDKKGLPGSEAWEDFAAICEKWGG